MESWRRYVLLQRSSLNRLYPNTMMKLRAVEDFDRIVPIGVREICKTLQSEGFLAYAVGGAIRDALLNRPIGDWDVTTNADPNQVVSLFPRTIPTGLQHGTVTVLIGQGAQRITVEVTTFRGEGAYSDGRRPDEVRFGVSFEEDLSRRDFVINAIAYDPVARILCDPLDGASDLRAQTIRAVGDAKTRFEEDGLRIMRAIRFSAVLGFALAEETVSAIPNALGALSKVSKERVRDEFLKANGGTVAFYWFGDWMQNWNPLGCFWHSGSTPVKTTTRCVSHDRFSPRSRGPRRRVFGGNL